MMKSKGKSLSTVRTPICVLLSAIFCSFTGSTVLAEIPQVDNDWKPVEIKDTVSYPSAMVFGVNGTENSATLSGEAAFSVIGSGEENRVIDIHADKITTIVLPAEGVRMNHAVGFETYYSSPSPAGTSSFELNVHAPIVSNVQTYPQLPIDDRLKGAGLEFTAQGGEGAKDRFGKSNISFLNPVSIDVKNITDSKIIHNRNAVAAIYEESKDGTCNKVTFHDVVKSKVYSDSQSVLYGLWSQNENNNFKEGGSSIEFKKDATFGVVNTQAGDLYGGFLYASSDNPALQGKQTKTKLISNKGSTLTFDVESTGNRVTNDTQRVQGLVGFSRESGVVDFDMEGKTDIAVNAGNLDVRGLTLYSESNSYTGGIFNGKATITANSDEASAYGLYLVSFDKSKSVVDFNDVDITINKSNSAYGQYFYASDSEVDVNHRGAVSVTQSNVVGKNGYAVYVYPDEKSTMNVNYEDLSIDVEKSGIKVKSENDGVGNLSIRGSLTLKKTIEGFLLESISESNGTSKLIVDGSFNADTDWLLNADGVGSTIRVSPKSGVESKFAGSTYAMNGGTLDIELNHKDASAKLFFNDYKEKPTKGTINLSLSHGGVWQAKGNKPSSLTQMQLSAGGIADLTTAETQLSYPTLLVNNITGEGGQIIMEVNTEETEGQHIWVFERSSGRHEIVPRNLSSSTPSGKPILLIKSIGGKASPEDYDAMFYSKVPVAVGELKYIVGSTKDVLGEAEELGNADLEAGIDEKENLKDWYLYPSTHAGEQETTDTAKGDFEVFGSQYVLGTALQETLRQRLGDVHSFMFKEGDKAPWVKIDSRQWRMRSMENIRSQRLNIHTLKAGMDRRFDNGGDHRDLFGGYLSYTWADNSGLSASKIKMKGYELGAYWTRLQDNELYYDLVGRFGGSRSRITSNSEGTRAEGIDGNYGGVSLEVGRRWQPRPDWYVEPQAQVTYIRYGSSSIDTDSGLHARVGGYNSLVTRIGSTFEHHFEKPFNQPVTLYGKLMFEREWMAKPEVTFNEGNHYDLDFKANRFVYGIGLEGGFAKDNTWYAAAERSTGNKFRENWRFNAGLRIPF